MHKKCSVCIDAVCRSCQASLNSSMESLKAELNTALQCDREAEDEVKKLKVRASKTNHIIKHTLQGLMHFLHQI